MTQRTNGKANTTPNGFQTVFRVKGTRARQKTSNATNQTSRNTFNARRSHTKSRTGCQNCKQRRVKCDETRVGGCSNCRNHGIDCDYLLSNLADVVSSNSSPSSPSTRAVTATSALSSVATPTSLNSLTLYSPPSRSTPFEYELPTGITPYYQTLRHFENFTCQTITSPDGMRIYQSSVLAIADQNDYLMHSILGMSAGHLAWHARLQDSPIELKMHKKAEAYHWQKALGAFRSSLDSTDEPTAETVDALMSTCMLIGIHSYTLFEGEGNTSFVWKPEDRRSEALQWLRSGFRVVLQSVRNRVALSRWLDIFTSAVPSEAGLKVDFDVGQGVYKDFLDICGIDRQSTPQNNPYLETVKDLFALFRMGQPTMIGFGPLMAFAGRLTGPFQELLIRRDTAALLVIAHWLTLTYQLQLWWIQDRARQECTAIITFLQNDKDPRIRRMLEFPATVMNISPFDG